MNDPNIRALKDNRPPTILRLNNNNTTTAATSQNGTTTSSTVVQPSTTVTSSMTDTSVDDIVTSSPNTRNCEEPSTVCLDGADSDFKGNVLVGGLPVCDDSWSLASATVVCRELGFQKAKRWFVGSRFGNDTRNFKMDNVKCNGTETRLVDCPFNPQNDCGPGEVAGVECDTRNYTDILKSECYELDVIYSTGDGISQIFNNISTPDQCQAKCKNATVHCKHFSYYPDIKRCDLKNGNSKEFKHGAISGPQSCTNETAANPSASSTSTNCFESGIGYNYGEYLDYGYTDDVNLCQQRCQAFSGCRYFSYYQSSNECFMKTGNESKRAHNDVTSGPKYCEGDRNKTAAANRYSDCWKAGSVCLLGGLKVNEGNVHIGGKPVCDDSWDLKDGLVVCRELGYHAIVKITKESTYGKVNPDFAMDNVMCLGNEPSIKNCTFSADDDCGASEGAGVMCDTRSKQEIDDELRLIQMCFDEGVSYSFGEYIDFEVSYSPLACQKHCQNHADCSHFTFYPESGRCYRKMGNEKKSTEGAMSGPRNCSDPAYTAPPPSTGSTTPSTCDSPGAICLQGGQNSSEGNILIENRPICDDDWNLINAHVACKQLGFIGALSFTKESKFGLTSAQFRMDNVQCDGTEERLIDCQYQRQHDCSEGEAAGVVCDTRTKDVEEIQELSCFEPGVSYSPGNWIDYDILLSAYDCQVHCQAHPECMHFSFYKDTQKCYRKTTNTKFNSAAAISGPRKCNTTTTTVKTGADGSTSPTVPTTTERNCNVPGVVCLKRGNSPNEGNVFIGGKPVCDDSWDTRDARVVCHELGYADVLETYIESHFGAVNEIFAMDNVECTGSEQSLGVCTHTSTDDCGPQEGAGVLCDNGTQIEIPAECQGEDKLCLIGGQTEYEGNVYFGGQPVCDDGWSFANAHVVCVSLGFAEAEVPKKESTFGMVPSRYGATDVLCQGRESHFRECHKTTDEINCNRMEGAGVVCRPERRTSGNTVQYGSSASNAVATLFVLATVCVVSVLVWRYREQVRHIISREIMVRISGTGPLLS